MVRTGRSTWMGDLDVSRTWQLAALGAGQATLDIPRYLPDGSVHPLNDAKYLDTNGGSYVLIADEAGSGPWFGATAAAVAGPGGTQVTCYQPWRILSRRRPGKRNYRNVQAGLIAQDVLRVGLAGVPGLRLASWQFDGVGELIDAYALTGQDVQSVLNDLSLRSGLALSIDAATGTVAFGPPVTVLVDGLLVAGTDITGWQYVTDPSRLVGTVSVLPTSFGRDRQTVYGSGGAHGWPAQDVVDANGAVGWGALDTAQGAVAEASKPAVTFSGTLAAGLRDVREGEVRRVLVPAAEWSGRVVTLQVLSRALQSRAQTMTGTFALLERTADDPVVQRSGPQIRNPYRRAGKQFPQRMADLERAVDRIRG